jgi:hypothetical protein
LIQSNVFINGVDQEQEPFNKKDKILEKNLNLK